MNKGLKHTYCSFVSYIGTKFCGSQRQTARRSLEKLDASDKMTIQQALDDSLNFILPKPCYTSGRKIIKSVDDQIEDQNIDNSIEDNKSINQNENLNATLNQSDKSNDIELKKNKQKRQLYFDDNDLFGYRTYITSRTDAGVCSTMNCYLFDLIHPNDKYYKTDYLTMAMNKYLVNKNLEVIVNKTIVFNKPAINYEIVKEKQYCYRIGFLKPDILTKSYISDSTFLDNNTESDNSDYELKHTNKALEFPGYKDNLSSYALYSYAPINELNRCLLLNSKYFSVKNNKLEERIINIEKMKEAAKMFCGTFNFTSFSTFNNKTNLITKPPREPVKTISRFEFKERYVQDDLEFDSRYGNFIWFDVFVKADGFLYNQIRRMMGCLLAYGFDLINKDDIEFMLKNPNCKNFHPNCAVTPPSGLYLNRIEFSEEIEEHFQSDEEIDEELEEKTISH